MSTIPNSVGPQQFLGRMRRFARILMRAGDYRRQLIDLGHPAVAETGARTILLDQWRMASVGLNAVPCTTMPEDTVAALIELETAADGNRARVDDSPVPASR